MYYLINSLFADKYAFSMTGVIALEKVYTKDFGVTVYFREKRTATVQLLPDFGAFANQILREMETITVSYDANNETIRQL